MFKLTCESHIPVNPATKKNAINDITDKNIRSFFKDPLIRVNVQLTTLMVAGIEIIIVMVLYNARLL
jgi:hypothetical protein